MVPLVGQKEHSSSVYALSLCLWMCKGILLSMVQFIYNSALENLNLWNANHKHNPQRLGSGIFFGFKNFHWMLNWMPYATYQSWKQQSPSKIYIFVFSPCNERCPLCLEYLSTYYLPLCIDREKYIKFNNTSVLWRNQELPRQGCKNKQRVFRKCVTVHTCCMKY